MEFSYTQKKGCRFAFRIADMNIALAFDLPINKICFSEAYQKFFSSSQNSEFTIHTIYTKYTKFPRFSLSNKNLIWNVNYYWRLYKKDGHLIFIFEPLNYRKGEFSTNISGNIFFSGNRYRFKLERNYDGFESVKSQLPQPYRVAIFSPNFKEGKIFVDSSHSKKLFPNPLGYPLLELFLSCLLPSLNKGAVFHASGVMDNNRGYLFLGSQGKGKSTMVKLWQDKAAIIHDDYIIIRKINDSFIAFSIPCWRINLNSVVLKGVLVKKIFFLHHNSQNIISRKFGMQALFMLLSNCFSMIIHQENTIKLCRNIAEEIPCYSLGFVPNMKIIDFINSQV